MNTTSSNLKYNNNNNNNNNSSSNNNNHQTPSSSTTTSVPTTTKASLSKQSVKISSKFSASQPFLPAYETNNNNNHHHSHGHGKADNELSGGSSVSGPKKLLSALQQHQQQSKMSNAAELEAANVEFQLINSASSAKHLIAQAQWSERVYSLKELIESNQQQQSSLCSSLSSTQNTNNNNNTSLDAIKFPLVVKIVKGSYGVVKEKSATSLLSKSSVHNLCLYQKCKFTNVLCQSIRYKVKTTDELKSHFIK